MWWKIEWNNWEIAIFNVWFIRVTLKIEEKQTICIIIKDT
jgi:hypothetical protein